MKNVLCVGSITADIITSPVDSLPEKGTLRAVENITISVGGCASNAAIDLAKLGIPVAIASKLGDDPMGRYVKDELEKHGVNIRGLVTGSVPTTVSNVCLTSDGERSFLYSPGSAADFSIADVDRNLLEMTDIVFVAGAMLLKRFDGRECADLLRAARAAGKTTVMDTAWDYEGIWLDKISEALPYLDIFMPSIAEAKKLAGVDDDDGYREIAARLKAIGPKNIVVKLGNKGAYMLKENGDEMLAPTYTSIKPVDTTGAGDAFCAGFIAGLSLGKAYDECLRLGNAVGTSCVRKIGASAGILSMQETVRFMNENIPG